jgi:hypothetical protein
MLGTSDTADPTSNGETWGNAIDRKAGTLSRQVVMLAPIAKARRSLKSRCNT